MIKRTVFIGNPAYLSAEKGQLKIALREENGLKNEVKSIPIEDMGMLLIENAQVTISHVLISKLLENNVVIVSCDERHMPQGMMLGYTGHQESSEISRYQIEATEPLKKNIWSQIVTAKVLNQALVLERMGKNPLRLRQLAKEIKSGDTTNIEAQAAAHYWRSLFGSQWVRDPDTGPPPNSHLNYGYAILRAISGRSIVGAGLLPMLGVHHRNKYNPYCLADDFMEPFRPFVDWLVLSHPDFMDKLLVEKADKAKLLAVATIDTEFMGQMSPLMIASQRMATSLARIYRGETRKIICPMLPKRS